MRGMRCPKCSSSACSGGEFMNSQWSHTRPDCKVHCMMCGLILYGDQARHLIETAKRVELARIEQEQRIEEELRAERARKAEQLPPPPAVITVPLELLVSAEITKCAWHKCSEPKRANSIYCSSKCRVAKAHANEWERRKAAKRAGADVSSVQGVSSDRASA
jgi:hypothetical protein